MTDPTDEKRILPKLGNYADEAFYTLLGVVAFLTEELAWQGAIDAKRFAANLREVPTAGDPPPPPEVQALRQSIVDLIASGLESRSNG